MFKMFLAILSMVLSFSDCKYYDMGFGIANPEQLDFSVSNCSSGNGKIFEMNSLENTVTFPVSDFKRPLEFLIKVYAQSFPATGNFKTEIQISDDYEYWNGTQTVICDRIYNPCERRAVDKPIWPKEETISKKAPKMLLIPNPAKDKLSVQIDGLEPYALLQITDALGKEVWQQNITGKTELDVHSLSKGIYRVRARDQIHIVVKTLVIE